MTDKEFPAPPPRDASAYPLAPVQSRGEPPLIGRARRVGWVLLLLCLVALAAARGVAAVYAPWLTGVAIGCALLGGLAIVNVALVRSLYRQIEDADDV